MKGSFRRLKCIRCAFSKIHLVDRCLILFMSVLLVQSAYSLFFPTASAADVSDIDIVVRTSSAAIFGYFLSANFIRHTLPGNPEPPEDPPISSVPPTPEKSVAPQNRIGFALPGDTEPQLTGTAKRTNSPSANEATPSGRFQIIAATTVGLFCLVVLLMVRNLYSSSGVEADSAIAASATATVTQFRDFISGCVGFLIGCPTSGESRN